MIMRIIHIIVTFILSIGIMSFIVSCKNDRETTNEQTLPLSTSAGSYLFKYNVDNSVFVTQHITDQSGLHLARGEWKKSYQSMLNFPINNKQYILKHADDGSWYLQEMYNSGDIGFVSDSGKWVNYYGTMVAMPKDDHLYIFRQNKEHKHWYINEVNDDGKLLSSCDDGEWHQYYDTAVAFQTEEKSCFFAQTSQKGDNYHWTIQCVTKSGKLAKADGGNWKHFWDSAVVLKTKTDNYILFNRKVFGDDPWKIVKINKNGTMGEETDSGKWEHDYPTLSSLEYNGKVYVIGQKKNEYFFFQHVDENGELKSESDGGYWKRYYDYLLRFNLAPKYLELSDWMGRLSSTISSRSLAEIVLPGSHDAGMNEADRHSCSIGASTCNTITQSGDIEHQLYRGSRYFDIRPDLRPDSDGSDWSTAHTSEFHSKMQGCEGEKRKSIIKSLNDFFHNKDHQKELVILKISHCGMAPTKKAKTCSRDQMNNIAKSLYNNLDNVIKGDDCNIRSMSLDEILQKGNILLVFDGNIDSDTSKGIFKWGYDDDFYLYDHYSNTESYDSMKEDQIGKLLNDEHHSYREGFLLSWTLTQDTKTAIGCDVGPFSSILDLATKANVNLYRELHRLQTSGQLTKTLFPNVIYVDKFNGEATRAAIYLNEKYENLNP